MVKKFALGVVAVMLVMFAVGLAGVFSKVAHAESCNPKTGVCIGGPTATPCGHLGQSCCNVNGYAYNCLGATACNPGTNKCWPSTISCEVQCYSNNLTAEWIGFSVGGGNTTAQDLAAAESVCVQAGLNYNIYTCSYY